MSAPLPRPSLAGRCTTLSPIQWGIQQAAPPPIRQPIVIGGDDAPLGDEEAPGVTAVAADRNHAAGLQTTAAFEDQLAVPFGKDAQPQTEWDEGPAHSDTH